MFGIAIFSSESLNWYIPKR